MDEASEYPLFMLVSYGDVKKSGTYQSVRDFAAGYVAAWEEDETPPELMIFRVEKEGAEPELAWTMDPQEDDGFWKLVAEAEKIKKAKPVD